MRWMAWAGLALLAAGCSDSMGGSRVRAVTGELVVDPAVVDFGDVAVGKEQRTTVLLRNDGLLPMPVDSLQSSATDAAFEVKGLPCTVGAGETARVEVRYHPTVIGSHARSLSLATATQANLPLDLRGHAVMGLAQLSSESIDFGDVVLNELGTQVLNLNNNDGRAQTDVTVAAPAGADAASFHVARNGTLPLGPEEALKVRIDFIPARAGAFSATVNVTPCPTCSAHAIALTGTGVVRLVDATPVAANFGEVKMGSSASQPFSVVNNSKSKLVLKAIELAGDPAFTAVLDGQTAPIALAPGQSMTGVLKFAPMSLGSQTSQVTLRVSDGAPAQIALAGNGIGPVLDASPRTKYLGEVALGTSRSTTLTIGNLGLDPHKVAPLAFGAVSIKSADAGWTVTGPAATPLEPGDTAAVQIQFAPTAAGTSRAVLVLQSNDALNPSVEVPVSALARQLAPCNLTLNPGAALSFGAVPVNHPTTQGFEITNAGTDDCIVGEPSLSSGGPAFHWPGLVIPSGRTLPPAGRMSMRIEFTPEQATAYAGGVDVYVSNPGSPRLHLSLDGSGDSGCFFLTPGAVDFGSAQTGCTAAEQTAYAVNQCPQTVTITGIATSSGPFHLGPGAPGTPVQVAPNSSIAIPIDYQAATPGDDIGQLRVTTDLRPGAPYQIGLTAGAQAEQNVTDQWEQSTPKVDLLIVIDNSGSMDDEQKALADNLGVLWNRIALANADFHIAVTTTGMESYTAGWTQCPGGAQGGEAGRFFPVDNSRPRILTPQTPNVKDALFANTNVGLCHWDERGFDPIYAALSAPLINATKAPGTAQANDGNAGFLRDDARLSLLVVSDTDDADDITNPPPVTDWIPKLEAIKHGAHDLISFAGIVPMRNCPSIEKVGDRYMNFAKAWGPGATTYDICDLNNFGVMLNNALGSLLQPLTSFPLSLHPRDAASLQVTVNGAPVSGWTWDARSNRVVFPQGQAPAPGSHIAAKYLAACN
jgi:hypothetical protein